MGSGEMSSALVESDTSAQGGREMEGGMMRKARRGRGERRT